MKQRQKPEGDVWALFQEQEAVNPAQLEQFKIYHQLLEEWNAVHNLTAITTLSAVVSQHFRDSLAIREFIDLSAISTIADVGSGAGFPGIPLKIMFPHLNVLLIEVTRKKQDFLTHLIRELGLTSVEIADLDWRTFLRTTQGTIDLFVSRAAIDELELTRAFRSNCPYRSATIAYWTAAEWECDPKAEPYLVTIHQYKIKQKERKIAIFKAADLGKAN